MTTRDAEMIMRDAEMIAHGVDVTARERNAAGDCIERAVVFPGAQGPVIGILAGPRGSWRAGVLIVAGQPQTRAGAHRMFVDLARGLARQGVASLRFDVGGWGDSPGEPLAFERSDADIAAAASCLRKALPAAAPLWAWGLCDGASAAVLALPAMRMAGAEPAAVCMVNPWVRTEASLGAAMIRTYYARRILDPEFWQRLLSGKIPLRNLIGDPLRHLGRRFGIATRVDAGAGAPTGSAASGAADAAVAATATTAATAATAATATAASSGTGSSTADSAVTVAHAPDLPSQMIEALSAYRGEVYTVLAGADLTAGESEALMRSDKRWLRRIDRRDRLLRVADADHTFSDATHWQAVIDWVATHAGRR